MGCGCKQPKIETPYQTPEPITVPEPPKEEPTKTEDNG